jgi:phage-related protein
MAQAMGMDLQSATMLVGKALNDPVKGMTALTRSGVQFTDAQKEAIAAMVEMGDTAGAQQIILKELEVQFGGSAEAAGKTFGGQLDIMKNALGNVGEEIGGALIPVLTDMAIKFGPGLIEGAKKFADWAVTDLIPALQRIGVWLETNIPVAIAALKKAWLDAQPTVEVLKGIFEDIGEVLGVVFEWLKVNVPKAIATLKQAWLDAQPTIETIKGIFEDIGEVLGTVWDWLSEKIPAAVAAVTGAFDAAKGAISGIIGTIEGVISKIADAIAKLREFLNMPTTPGQSYGGTPTGKPGGAGYGSTPTGPSGAPGYGGTPTRGMAGASGFAFNITINAPGGNPQAVAVAAQQGVMAAARSMGLA